MHIKSIHLDGFKSYQKHTDITGFSPQFNAITGYNGSGKSNVLDSICFILGINKLDNIRAKCMSELISHGGTKATVQIRFDNTDKSTSPYGMESMDEITVQRTITAQATGKTCATSYILNGHSATNSRIQDFFRGIGLNVNNPHFLIMQGRITTVLNMKPEEILGMVEEAAGTKMYDQKKKEAEKTMNMKQAKLDEIDRIFEASIGPRMEKFREDRKNMIEVTRLRKIKETAERKLEAYQYYQSKETLEKYIANVETATKDLADIKKKAEEVAAELQEKEAEKANLDAMQNNDQAEKKLSDVQRAKQGVALKLDSERIRVCDAVARIESEIVRVEDAVIRDRNALEEKRKNLEETKAANSNDIQSHKNNEEAVESLRDELESLTRGTVANDKGEHVSVETMIQDTRSKAASLEAAIKTAGNRRERARNRLAQLEKELSDENSKSKSVLDNMKKHENDIKKLKSQMEALEFNAEEHDEMTERNEFLKIRYAELEEANTRILQETCHGRFSMVFTHPPIPGFERKRDVVGLVIHCMKIKEGCEIYGAAIDVAAGSMYSNVVVRTQEIARILIDGKAFSGRRTMIPIDENERNNGRFSTISNHIFNLAKEIADRRGEKIVQLLEIIEYPSEINNTFISAFGHVLVVDTIECASEIAYNPAIRTRVLTVRGDDVKPNGVMSGGFCEAGKNSLLMQLRPWHKNTEESNEAELEMNDIQKKLQANEKTAQKYKSMSATLEKLEHGLTMINNNISNSKLGMIQKDVEEQKSIIETATKEIEESSIELKTVQAKVKELESKRNNDKGSQDKMKKELAAKLVEAEKRAAAHKDKAEKARRAVLQLQAGYDDLARTLEKLEREQAKRREELAELKVQVPTVEEAYNKAKNEENGAQADLEKMREDHRSLTTRISKASKEYDLLRREVTRNNQIIEDCGKNLVRLEAAKKENQKILQGMLKKSEWLEEEQAHFNKKGGMYDFEGYSIKKGTEEIKKFSDTVEKIERSLCMKNISNLDTCEAKVLDIRNKRDKLEEDFTMLRKTIAILDQKKVDELNRAHKSVNKDFGTIFNCLLPDATAQLIPPEGKEVTDGLEVKVAFNGIVKDSLHELSGGQRSLVALSLILAMLKFKPAPLYILDEVDAALDLSHTANIGMMIKTHFSDNQFIIVSLKQGMFSNADSLFQTSFADGHSSCRLLTGAALIKAKNDTKLAQQAQEMAEGEQGSPKKSKKSAARKLAQRIEEDEEM